MTTNPLRVLRIAAAAATLAMTTMAIASESGHAAADQVSEASYRDFLDNWLYTHAGDDRGFGPEHDLARDNIADLLTSFGLDVVLEPFTYDSDTYYNVVATLPGTVNPQHVYIIGAHYDSAGNPGADDDGSGVALMLEAARILSRYDADATIRFIAFDREEQGLIGSRAYVTDHAGDDIRGMISADMVAYNTGANLAEIHGRSASNGVKIPLGEAITTYGDGLSYGLWGSWDASDHAPFEWAGFPACLLIEDWGNPYYHTQNDNVDTPNYIDYAFAVRMTRSVVGFLVDQAGVEVPVEQTVYPAAFEVAFGAYRSGTLADLFDSDDAWVVIEQRPSFSPLLPLIRMEVSGTAGAGTASQLLVTIETAATALPGRPPQRLLLHDYDASTWAIVDERPATPGDTVVEVTIDTDPGRFIQTGTSALGMRLEWFDPGNVFFPAWQVRTDQAIWTITP